MTISPTLLAPLWPSANNLAASLLPPLPGDPSNALTSGVGFLRQSSAIPSSDTVDPSWAGFPPYNLSDTGVAELAWLASADNALPTPAAAPAAPAFVDFLFTRQPGRALPPLASSRLFVSPWLFVNGPGLYWDPLGGGVLLTENQRKRVPWETLVGDSSADTTGIILDALALVVLVPSARTVVPGLTFTVAMNAVYV